jgi:hypothetical protein
MTQTMHPSTSARTITVNGRIYTAVAGTPVTAPDHDAAVLSANGWINAAGTGASGSGTTAQRPTSPKKGDTYHDTTLGYVIFHDGGAWRHQSTGALV